MNVGLAWTTDNACVFRVVVLALFVVSALAAAGDAHANDLGDALEDVQESGMMERSPAIEDSEAKPFDYALMALIGSRDIPKGKAPEEYDCWQSLVDGDPRSTFRYGDNEKVTNRWCHEFKFRRDRVPGYKTLGKVRLSQKELRPILEAAANETDIPYVILDTFVRFASGYRPGVISDRGELGLFQLRPEVIAEMGVKDPFDPRQNIFAGARYLGLMLDRYDGHLEPALAALMAGPAVVDRAGGHPPDDKRVVWFVREVRRFYQVSLKAFPAMQSAANIAHVMTWTDAH